MGNRLKPVNIANNGVQFLTIATDCGQRVVGGRSEATIAGRRAMTQK
jgi:hypothetical protein